MTSDPETLTDIVAAALGNGLTYRALRDQAFDDEESYRPSIDTLHKVANGKNIHLTPKLVRAIAAGLHIPPGRAQRAAAVQYAGLSPADFSGATALRYPHADEIELGPEEAIVDRWDKDDTDRRNHPDS